jgi:ATP-dependent helicase/nuclease subunit A
MPTDLLARRLQVSGDLPKPMIACAGTGPAAPVSGGTPPWTTEQLYAIERRDGDLLLDAGAGSGKTSVLVERFVRAVLEDGVAVESILTITFTEKAAAEMRDRIRARLRELGADDAARATEGAFISTIHGFCARALRAHALTAGIDPLFTVLDEPEAGRLADAAFGEALEDLAQNAPGGVELIAAYTPGTLRAGISAVYGELRSRGEPEPALPALPPIDAGELAAARDELAAAAAIAAGELAAVQSPSARVEQAIERLGHCIELLEDGERWTGDGEDGVSEATAGAGEAAAGAGDDRVPWPGELDRFCLPGGNGAALTTAACVAYGEALARLRAACEHRWAQHAHALLDTLLRSYGARYTCRKREHSGLDFEDLELLTRELLGADAELRERYRARFERIMVDELQDTNAVQLELIEHLARGNLFTVGDAQQSIYAFRHADVELFARRGERLAQIGARATLQTNFRSRREILDVLNLTFAPQLSERFTPLGAGRTDPPTADPLVELQVADKGANWADEGVAAPWRVAEARALAGRVRQLIADGAAPGEIVVLTRATTDLRAYERALEERGIPTYVIGGRGYWSHPQVVDLVCYLRALANPRDEEALYTVLASPLVGVSVDALVVLAAASRASGRDPWWVLREPEERLEQLAGDDAAKLSAFARWLAVERAAAGRTEIEQLIDRALELTGYDLAVLAMPGGRRRLANVRKLMRLAREHEAAAGSELRDFLELVAGRASEWGPADSRESEAPVEGEALDAVRLMTIHRAKGLEFEIVCVADLGRGPRWGTELMRVGRDGRFGLRLARPGTGKREPALHYRALGDERQQADAREERRLFYVATTRARERLILSGAAKLDQWPSEGAGGPIAWLGPALLGDVEPMIERGSGVTDAGVRFTFVREGESTEIVLPIGARRPSVADEALGVRPVPQPPPAAAPAPPVTALSYSALGQYKRCGYRFYAERVLGLPAVADRPGSVEVEPGAEAEVEVEARREGGQGEGAEELGIGAADRGVLVHDLLERLDFRRPVKPTLAMVAAARERTGLAAPVSDVDAAEAAELVQRFAATELCARLGRATAVAREERFAFTLGEPAGGVLVVGALDVIAREQGGRSLVVDYKTDRLERVDPRELVASAYGIQRLVYALAALRAGAGEVEVAHVFLEAADEPVTARFRQADVPDLERQLSRLAEGVLRREFPVTEQPHRGICRGCPAEGGLCSWPLELTRRDTPDRLF